MKLLEVRGSDLSIIQWVLFYDKEYPLPERTVTKDLGMIISKITGFDCQKKASDTEIVKIEGEDET